MVSLTGRFRDAYGDGYVLGPVRAILGVLLTWQALSAAQELGTLGYFGDSFHLSMLPEWLVPSHRVYALVLAARVCLSIMATIGVWARPALGLSALSGLWLLLCDRLQFHHNRYSLLCYALLLSLTPCDRSWRATEPAVPEPRTGPFWAVHLAQLQVSIVYLASGGSKLLDPDWRSGVVLADRIARHGHEAVAAGVPRRLVDTFARADVASATAKLAIMTELTICVALWLRPTRVVALWWGVWFHVVIQLASNVEVFSVLSIAIYGVFATPDYHARTLRFDPSRFWGKAAGTLVPLFDWLGRFEVKPWEPDDKRGHSVVVIRRDGGRVTGVRALAVFAQCIPVLFPLWAPIAFVASFTSKGELTTAPPS
ncbi:MAG: HTTM domain-containing protein [Deltaproteobacteria bacterium]|nr:HTTM domain-containing protein [Deltaproteobacteria bacterium]